MKKEKVVTVSMFGKFTISYREKKISESVRSVENQSWQLIKYMLVNADRVISAEEIAQELALAGRVTDTANTLRVRLSRSRDILEDIGLGSFKEGLILFGDGQFWVNKDYRIESDQKKIDQCYFSMLTQKTPRREDLDKCIEGLDCFRGSYLENSRSIPWISGARAHYDKVYLQLLDYCMDAMAEMGDYTHADDVWNSALRVKPREPDVHERLLRGLISHNRIAEAATYYAKLAVLFANAGLILPEFNSLINRYG